MEKVIEILNKLKENSGKRLQEILEENKDNSLLKDVLYFVYNNSQYVCCQMFFSLFCKIVLLIVNNT